MKIGFLEYRLLDDYAHYMLIAAAFFLSLGEVIRSVITSQTNAQKSKTTQKDKVEQEELVFEISTRIVSLTHAILVCVFAIYNLAGDSPIQEDKMFGWSPGATITLMFTSGYFLSDTIEIVRFCFPKRIVFLIHHIASFLTLSLGVTPINQYWGMWFLLFELSTPFMNLRWAMIKLGNTKSGAFHLAEIAFAVSFFGIRILGGITFSYMCVSSMVELIQCDVPDPVRYPHYDPAYGVPRNVLVAFCISNVVFNLLNLYWGGLIVQKTFRKIAGKKTYDANMMRNPDGGDFGLSSTKKTD